MENQKSSIGGVIAIVIGIVLLLAVAGSCSGSSDREAKETLQRGLEKSYSGAPLTREEQNYVDGYNKWKREQDAQEYNKKYYGK